MERNPQTDLVHLGERVDDLQNGFYVIQNPEKFCFGMDAVLLSGFAKIRNNAIVLDMGTGTGIIPILLKSREKGTHFTGLEIQKECADMASRSVAYNGLESAIDIVCGDIKEAAEIFGAASFDVVTSNPPYMIGEHGLRNPYMAKAIARHEVLCTVYPYIDREPNMVLIEACKGGNSRITVERPLIVYEKPGEYTKSILEIYGMV